MRKEPQLRHNLSIMTVSLRFKKKCWNPNSFKNLSLGLPLQNVSGNAGWKPHVCKRNTAYFKGHFSGKFPTATDCLKRYSPVFLI